MKNRKKNRICFQFIFFGVKKSKFANRLKRALPKFRGDRSEVRGVNGRSKFAVAAVRRNFPSAQHRTDEYFSHSQVQATSPKNVHTPKKLFQILKRRFVGKNTKNDSSACFRFLPKLRFEKNPFLLCNKRIKNVHFYIPSFGFMQGMQYSKGFHIKINKKS